jgi:long-subunit fatty acid transport protein
VRRRSLLISSKWGFAGFRDFQSECGPEYTRGHLRQVWQNRIPLQHCQEALRTLPSTKRLENTWIIRIGAVQAVRPVEAPRRVCLRSKPGPFGRFETRVSDSDRQGLTIGTGYTGGNITIDAAYLYLHFNNRTITNSIAGQPSGSAPIVSLDGTYKGTAHLLGVTVAYKF